MKRMPARLVLLLVLLVLIPAGAGAAAGATGFFSGFPFSTALANLTIAFTIVVLFIFGLYAYASLARFAPYHSWVYLYLVSMTGVVWAVFLVNQGGALSDAIFILTTIIGINLIVHVFRFDRVEISGPTRGGSTGTSPEKGSPDTNPFLFWNPPRF